MCQGAEAWYHHGRLLYTMLVIIVKARWLCILSLHRLAVFIRCLWAGCKLTATSGESLLVICLSRKRMQHLHLVIDDVSHQCHLQTFKCETLFKVIEHIFTCLKILQVITTYGVTKNVDYFGLRIGSRYCVRCWRTIGVSGIAKFMFGRFDATSLTVSLIVTVRWNRQLFYQTYTDADAYSWR